MRGHCPENRGRKGRRGRRRLRVEAWGRRAVGNRLLGVRIDGSRAWKLEAPSEDETGGPA